MFCSSCGKRIPDDSVFCPECGTGLTKAAAGAEVDASKKWGGGAMAAMIVGTLFIPLIGLIVGGINLKDKDKGEQAKTLLVIGVIVFVINIAVVLGG